MRMSCSGCRILRKGCTEDCTIKPCLDWIKSPDSQANATLFLAKFYGRAGLINLIEAGHPHLRSAIFKSLLYEACGRIVDPISGSVGLLWSGNWAQCQAAVDAVLRGVPITQNASSSSSSAASSVAPPPPTTTTAFHTQIPPLKTYDIRHVSKDIPGSSSAAAEDKAAATTNKTRFKRSSTGCRPRNSLGRALSHQDSWLTHNNNNSVVDDESIFSVETVEGSPMMMMNKSITITTPNLGRVWRLNDPNDENGEIGLELTLGLSTGTPKI
ncbi:hypothetical protein Ddye_029961 [Dipteronia dyeriana]|uniref:LOB domain-containing protein n=1 Tax=Dipteronia dyeriana TaxID=168575 RepID=A0AAD9TFE3_9ROSI|nr:hypothetical protein Ddye_029961 [Dipteronia dyeriana]